MDINYDILAVLITLFFKRLYGMLYPRVFPLCQLSIFCLHHPYIFSSGAASGATVWTLILQQNILQKYTVKWES